MQHTNFTLVIGVKCTNRVSKPHSLIGHKNLARYGKCSQVCYKGITSIAIHIAPIRSYIAIYVHTSVHIHI